MTASATRLLRRIVDLRPGEVRITLLLFAYSFLAMTAYNIVRPATRSAFITGFGAHNLPYIQLTAGLLIGVLMHAYSQAVRRLPHRAVVPATQGGLVALLLAFWLLLGTGAAWVPVAFYVLGQILGILLISQFWTVASDSFDARQAKRLFGIIGAGASLGGALGAFTTRMSVHAVGTSNLLLLSAAVLTVSMAVVLAIVRSLPAVPRADPRDDRPAAGARESIRLLFASGHIRVIAVVIACVAVGATIVEQQLNMAAESIAGAAATDVITKFLADVTVYLSLAGFIVQVALTSRVHRSLGLGVALLLLPIGLGSSALVIVLSGAVWAAAAAKVLDGTLRYSIDKTSRELLFLPLPADLKYRIKPFIDVTVERIGKAAGALLVLVLIQPWGLGLDWRRLSYASLVFAGLWITATVWARREYLDAFRASIGAQAIAPDVMRVDAADAATIETLVEQLSSPDESAVLYAIEMLEGLDKRNLVTPLLLHHESPRVRTRALIALGSTRTAGTARWAELVGRMLQDADVGVRSAAMRALMVLRPNEAVARMRESLDDPEPRVALTAAVALADAAAAADVDAAFAALQRIAADVRPGAAGGRLEAARALAHIRHPRFRVLLVPLLHDGEIDVAREAIRSARDTGGADGLFVPALLTRLGDRTLKRTARETLIGYGTGVIEALGHVLRDPREHAWVRRHVPATLALVPSQRSMDLLVSTLEDGDRFLRARALDAIERLHRDQTALRLDPTTIERLLLKETSSYYSYFTLRHNLLQHPAGRPSLVVRAIDDTLDRLLDRIYRMLQLLYPGQGVEDARYAIEQGDTRQRAAAVEYLDTLLDGTVRKRVTPILDQMPVEEKVRVANLVLRSRARDVADTLAQLVHDDDPMVAASAIHFGEQQHLGPLADDLEFVLAHRPPEDRAVLQAALAARTSPPAADAAQGELTIVEIADRLRASPLGVHLPIEELFALAEAGQQVRCGAGRELCRPGDGGAAAWCLLDGTVSVTRADAPPQRLDAPAVVALEDVLAGRPHVATITGIGDSCCLRIDGSSLLTLLSNSMALVHGVFRMLLSQHGRSWGAVYVPAAHVPALVTRGGPPQPIDQLLLLRRHPFFARATPAQLFELAGITRPIELVAGRTLFTPQAPAAIYHVVEGALQLEPEGTGPIAAEAGVTIGVAETLAGLACGHRAVATRAGVALCLDHDALYAVLADRVELLQGLFSGVLDSAGDRTLAATPDAPEAV